jgi:GntR family transcriptional regulator/MocR family aminotransferase
VLSYERRRALLAWARRRDAIIIEDDYDSEFKREGLPVEPLKVMDQEARVVYTGTFSKTTYAGLRLGYVILPDSLRDSFRRARRLFESGAPSRLEQMTLALFMQSGDYERHLRRSIRVYRERHRYILHLFERHLPGAFEWSPSNAGLHVFGYWQGTKGELDRFAAQCQRRGIYWSATDAFYLRRPVASALFGYSHLRQEQMYAALRRMGRVYRRGPVL